MKRMLIVAVALLPLGCSFYYSSESSVKMLTSPSRSSKSSSGGDEEKKEAYRDDVRDFTVAWATKHDDLAGFETGLADLARRHGITDWEAEDVTYTAIGAGLKRADVRTADRARYESLLAGNAPAKVALIRDGYGS
jgi:hypothetical protein